MLHFKDNFQIFRSKFSIEQLFNALVVGIVLIVIVISIAAALRPISLEQYAEVQKVAQQQSFPETQNMAQLMLMQQKISVLDFYRLMHAQHFESSAMHKYPAITMQDIR